jgi:Fe2+ transport system protein FeoA
MAERPKLVHCPMCGLEFEKTDTICERGCLLNTGCSSVRCPGCDYEFPEKARTVSWLRRIFSRRRSVRSRPPEEEGTVSLTGLQAGERAELLDLTCMSSSRRNTLTVFGLTPGTEITLLQRSPSFVIRVGETELGLDREIAEGIYVRRG